jgi:hypothetical protein
MFYLPLIVAPWAKNFTAGVSSIRSGIVRGIRLFETQQLAYPFAMHTGDSKGRVGALAGVSWLQETDDLCPLCVCMCF